MGGRAAGGIRVAILAVVALLAVLWLAVEWVMVMGEFRDSLGWSGAARCAETNSFNLWLFFGRSNDGSWLDEWRPRLRTAAAVALMVRLLVRLLARV